MLIINQEPIDHSLIENAFQRIKTTAEMLTEVSCCERDEEFLAAAEEEVIDGILLAQEAERRFPKVAEETFRPALEQALRQWREHGASWELIENHMRQIREETAASLRMQLFTEELFTDLSESTDEEILDFFEKNRADFFAPPAVRALHLIRFPDHARAWLDYEIMLDWRHQIMDGRADFAALAKKHTQKKDGAIDLDWIPLERILNPFESVLFSLRQGEVSPILSYENALHLVYAAEVKPATMPPLDEKRGEICERLLILKKQEILRALAAELRLTAVIERREPELSGAEHSSPAVAPT